MAKAKVMFLTHSNVTSGNVAMWGRVDPLAAAQSQAGNVTHVIKWSAWLLAKTPTLYTPSDPLAPWRAQASPDVVGFKKGTGTLPDPITVTRYSYEVLVFIVALTHWGRDKMAATSQTSFSNGFSSMKMFEFPLIFHWSLFLRVQLTIYQCWFG